MGACNFECYGYGKDLKDAYRSAVDNGTWEDGHDSYNGTISTMYMPIEVTSQYKRYGTKACSKQIDKALDKMEKWTCYAIEVKGKALKEYRKRNGLERRKIRVYYFFGVAAC